MKDHEAANKALKDLKAKISAAETGGAPRPAGSSDKPPAVPDNNAAPVAPTTPVPTAL